MTGHAHAANSLCRWCVDTVSLLMITAVLSGLLLSCSGENSTSTSPNQTESIAGVDADANGVRDDVDRYIDTTYAGQVNGDLNKAVRQYAKAVQVSLVDADSHTLSLTHATERFRAQLLNTPSRSEAYLKADDQVKTANVPLLPADQWVTACQS